MPLSVVYARFLPSLAKRIKKVSFCTVCAVVLVAVVFLIAGVCVWNTYYHGSFDGSDTYPSSPAIITSGTVFAIYSAFMSSMVQVLAIFAVIAGVLIYRAVTLRKAGCGSESTFSGVQVERVADE